jgi:hypothetical protein
MQALVISYLIFALNIFLGLGYKTSNDVAITLRIESLLVLFFNFFNIG